MDGRRTFQGFLLSFFFLPEPPPAALAPGGFFRPVFRREAIIMGLAKQGEGEGDQGPFLPVCHYIRSVSYFLLAGCVWGEEEEEEEEEK